MKMITTKILQLACLMITEVVVAAQAQDRNITTR